MNKEEKPTAPPPNPKEKLGSGLKLEEVKFKKDEEVVKKDVEEKTRVEEPKKQVSPDDRSFHTNLTDSKFTSVKEFYDKLVRMERMLEWLIVQRVTDDQQLIKQPNIADIFKEIASKMDDKKTEGGG